MDGNLLKEARLEKHWTQEQAALALDVTQAYWSMMEKGHRPLSERFVRKALKVLNLPATALPLGSEEVAMPVCQGRSKNRPVGRSKSRPGEYVEDRGLSGSRASGAEACAA
jgi:transcriptional regulator with XRE-family HTH domain